jgi:Rho GTPase-activating protein 32
LIYITIHVCITCEFYLDSLNDFPLNTGNIAKNSRPKSLAVSTPARLLSLDEARALSRPNLDQTFIEVGAGPENLPKYHTVIDIPSRYGICSSPTSGLLAV